MNFTRGKSSYSAGGFPVPWLGSVVFLACCAIFHVVYNRHDWLGVTNQYHSFKTKMRHHNDVTDKSATAVQSTQRRHASHSWNHQGHTHWDYEVHVRPPTNANQTEGGACQITAQRRRKSSQSTPRNREKTQSDADWDGVSLGLVMQRTQYCKYASWQNSSKPRSGKGAQTDSGVSTRHSCQKTWESIVFISF